MKKRIISLMATLCVCLVASMPALAQEETDGSWPREIEAPEGTVVIYQPQPEKLEGDLLSGRTAFAVELKGAKEPVFGALWFEARLETDRANRIATIAAVKVTEVRFPEQDEVKTKKLNALLEKEVPAWNLPIDMDRLLTTLEFAGDRLEAMEKIETRPPKIIISREPAILVTLDGKPRVVKEKGSSLERVINTPFTILFEPSTKTYWLYADGDSWYSAKDIGGEWRLTKSIPAEVASRAPKADPEAEKATRDEAKAEPAKADEKIEPGPPPKIIVETEPAELVAIKGEPEYTPITGTELLYVSNTDSDLLMDIGGQKHYLLLAGRWYAGAGLEGPWKYVSGDDLPATFALIPEDSQMGTVLYAVPGTEVAKEAVLDAQIPQTAAVERAKASLTVEYDGKPKFEKIKGTKMTYAVNTATPVIFAEKKYYACDEAVWFVADSPKGPWAAATMIPAVIYTIPPDSPLYNVTYVRIYKSTPEVVYVGYTPGYTSTYVYHDTIVYGTGYYWPGWYGTYYYPRPSTWGFHVRYNPWSGWGFGLSYSTGPFTFSIGGGGWYRGGWWGPSHYHSYRHGYNHGYRHGAWSGYRAGSGYEARGNLYRTQYNQARTLSASQRAEVRSRASAAGVSARGGSRTGVSAGGAAAVVGAAGVTAAAISAAGDSTAKPSSRPNNVYAGRNGEVYRQTDQGWQQRSGNSWENRSGDISQAGWTSQGQTQAQTQKDRASQRAQSREPTQAQRDQASQRTQSYKASGATRSSTQQLNNSYQARQRGSERASSYNRARSSRPSGGGGRSRPSGGGGRRGGGRR
jgi:hypothetical protein